MITIDRIRAWLGRSGPVPAAPADVLAARDTRIAQLEKQLSNETFLSTKLGVEVAGLVKQNNALNARVDFALAEAARLRRELAFTETTPCECGGDAELHLRARLVSAEQRAARDRANAIRLDNRLAAAEGRPVIGSNA